jgi:hypothetical protein
VLLERLGSLDAQQGHQEQCDDDGAQPVERGADAAVGLDGNVEHARVEQRPEGEKHASAWHTTLGAEHRQGVVDEAEMREQPIEPPVGGVGIQ